MFHIRKEKRKIFHANKNKWIYTYTCFFTTDRWQKCSNNVFSYFHVCHFVMQKETNAILHWLKEIEESMHGTVDYTTMKQVDAINCCGIYYVGKPEMIEDAIGENIGITVDDSLYLVLPEDKVNNREKKIYSLEEVKDVQSKLMLIAGKAANVKEKVEHFVEVCIIASFISIPH